MQLPVLIRRKDFNYPVQFLEQESSCNSFVSTTKSNHISTKAYSLSPASKVERVSIFETELALEDISGFVVCIYVGQWWVACVLQVDEDNSVVKLTSFINMQGPSRLFRFPATPDILTVPAESILMKIDPKCIRGGTSILS